MSATLLVKLSITGVIAILLLL